MDVADPYPLITLITVTYNAAETLQRTIDSVAAQTYPYVEHLFIDGCSRDNTLELIHRYVEENTSAEVPHEIHLINEPDKGLYDAMNKGIRETKGDYLVFLNAGDTLASPTTLQELVSSVPWNDDKHTDPAVIYGETDLVDNEGHFLRHRRLSTPETLSWKSFTSGMLVCHQSFYVRTDLARQESYNLNYRFSADYDWCIRIMKRASLRGLALHNTHKVLTNYLNEGITTRNHRRSLWERLRIMAKHYGWPTALIRHAGFVVRAFIKP